MQAERAHALEKHITHHASLSRATFIEMLRLNPGDNQSARTSLGSSLIRDGRYSDALYFAQKWLQNTLESGVPLPRGGTDFGEPSDALYTPEIEAKLSECWSGEMVHTAALASFKLRGDCEQSQQYLRIAAKVNPFILLRIIGRISRPSASSVSFLRSFHLAFLTRLFYSGT